MTEKRKELLDQIEAFLFEMVRALEIPPARSGPGRPLILPAVCLWAGLLVCVLRGFDSQLTLWRLLAVDGFWRFGSYSVSDQAVYKRLSQSGLELLQNLFEKISAVLHERLAPFAQHQLALFASEVYALDATTLDKIARVLPTLRGVPSGDDQLLPGKAAALFDLRQQWRKVVFVQEPRQNDKVQARTLVEGLPPESLLLADLGYFGFAWFDELTEQRIWWIARLREKTSHTLQHSFYAQGTWDEIVFLGRYRTDRAASAVRLVQFRIGERCYRYITNVLDPRLLPMGEIAQLYARPWDIEMAFNLIKTDLGLHLL